MSVCRDEGGQFCVKHEGIKKTRLSTEGLFLHSARQVQNR